MRQTVVGDTNNKEKSKKGKQLLCAKKHQKKKKKKMLYSNYNDGKLIFINVFISMKTRNPNLYMQLMLVFSS